MVTVAILSGLRALGIRIRTRTLVATLALVVLGLFLATAPAAHAADPPPADPAAAAIAKDLEDEVMCVICGVPLEKSLDAPAAQRERAFISRMATAGASKQEIKDALVAEYGQAVLADPPASGFGLTAWLVPIIAFLAAIIALAIGLRRWRRQTAAAGAAEPGPVAPPLTDAEAARLEAELGK